MHDGDDLLVALIEHEDKAGLKPLGTGIWLVVQLESIIDTGLVR
jgi:hypothetical protein